MINVDMEIKREKLRVNRLLWKTLKSCMDTVSNIRVRNMYKNPELSILADEVEKGLRSEQKGLGDEYRKNSTNQGILIRYP